MDPSYLVIDLTTGEPAIVENVSLKTLERVAKGDLLIIDLDDRTYLRNDKYYPIREMNTI